MKEVTRLQGKTMLGTYVVSVFVEGGKIDHIETNGHTPHDDVIDLCGYLTKIHAKLVYDSIKAIKLTMAKHGEYRGVAIQ